MYENPPEDGDQMMRKLGLAPASNTEPVKENVQDIKNGEIDLVLAEAINQLQRKIKSEGKKLTHEEYADLIMKEIPQLSQLSNKSDKLLKDHLQQLQSKTEVLPTDMGPLLGLDPIAAKKKIVLQKSSIIDEPEFKNFHLKTRTKPVKDEAYDTQPELAKSERKSTATESEVLEVKLKPVSKIAIEKQDQLSGEVELNHYLEDLTNRLKSMKLKPTQLVQVKREISIDENKEIEKAIKVAQKVSKQKTPTPDRNKMAEVFVETLIKELPNQSLTDFVDKQTITRRVSSIPSLEKISVDEGKEIASFITNSLSPKQTKPPTSESLEKSLEDTFKALKQRKMPVKEEKPEKFIFSDIFLRSVPEVASNSALDSVDLASNLTDMYENPPEDGDQMVRKLGLAPASNTEPVKENVQDIKNGEIDLVLAEAINQLKIKIKSEGKKLTQEEYADLFMKEIPQLSQLSNKSDKLLKDHLQQLQSKTEISPSDVAPLLGLDSIDVKEDIVPQKSSLVDEPEFVTFKLKTRKREVGETATDAQDNLDNSKREQSK
jgi:hypothetical protein